MDEALGPSARVPALQKGPYLLHLEALADQAESVRASAVADSKQTLLCTYLSAVLLVGLILNATLGWSWADPIAAIAVKEGRDAWQGKGCCPTPAAAAPIPAAGADACGCRPGCDCCK